MTDNAKQVREHRKFGAALTVAFALVGSLLLWRDHHTAMTVFYVLSAVTLVLTLVIPAIMKYPILFFTAIGWFNTKVILVLTFYFVITPTGLLMRLFGKDPLDKKWKVERNTYWQERDHTSVTPKHIEKPF